MTLLVKAYSEKEHKRLQKSLLDMPIRNPDKPKRFPKDISRRLFPQDEKRGIREHVEWAIAKHADIQLPRSLNRKGPHRDIPFHTSSAGKQICNLDQGGDGRQDSERAKIGTESAGKLSTEANQRTPHRHSFARSLGTPERPGDDTVRVKLV